MLTLFIGFFLSVVAAVVPTTLYTLTFYLADRYEREPLWLAGVAFLWGAAPAILASVVAEILLGNSLIQKPGTLASAVMEAAVIAPVIEELAKGAALLLIVWFFSRHFDGLLDGLTYGALIGFGFAMTENFFYFVGALNEGGLADLSVLIFLRSILFGLNHAFYTGLTGIGFGLAVNTPHASQRILRPLIGLLAAIGVHSLHNLGASLSQVNGLSILISMGLAAVGLGLIGLAFGLGWQRERAIIGRELVQEVPGLLSDLEYETLRQYGPRRRPAGMARATNPQYRQRMELLTKLAFRKHRLGQLGAKADPGLLEEIGGMREQAIALFIPDRVSG